MVPIAVNAKTLFDPDFGVGQRKRNLPLQIWRIAGLLEELSAGWRTLKLLRDGLKSWSEACGWRVSLARPPRCQRGLMEKLIERVIDADVLLHIEVGRRRILGEIEFRGGGLHQKVVQPRHEDGNLQRNAVFADGRRQMGQVLRLFL